MQKSVLSKSGGLNVANKVVISSDEREHLHCVGGDP